MAGLVRGWTEPASHSAHGDLGVPTTPAHGATAGHACCRGRVHPPGAGSHACQQRSPTPDTCVHTVSAVYITPVPSVLRVILVWSSTTPGVDEPRFALCAPPAGTTTQRARQNEGALCWQ
eukprot:366492-Chlamydomonas_euryale.AAC.5